MSSQTPNLNLVLPVGTEKVSRQIINDNNTKIDTAVGANSQAITNLNAKSFDLPANNTNFNNITVAGAYCFSWITNGTTYNRPVNQGGLLVVSIGYNAEVKSQQYTDTNGKVHTRGYHDGAWTSWQELAIKGTRMLIGEGVPAASLNVQLSQSIQNFDSVQIIFTKGNTNGCFLERTIPKDNYAAGSGDTIGIGAYNNTTYHAYVECGFTGNSNFYIATYNVAGWTLSKVYIVGLK